MEETYNLTAIILNRRAQGEGDGRVTVYSLERGKLELTVRGMKKIKSKLAGHLEPLTLGEIMAIRGRQYDYVGAAVSENCYADIKNNLDKLTVAGEAVNIFNKLVKAGQADEKLFNLLKDYLEILNSLDSGQLNSFFIFKLLSELGYKPELYCCVNCGGKLAPAGLKFDASRGGLVCDKCPAEPGLTISENSVKLLRLAENCDLKKLVKIKTDKKTEKEARIIMSSFLKYFL